MPDAGCRMKFLMDVGGDGNGNGGVKGDEAGCGEEKGGEMCG